MQFYGGHKLEIVEKNKLISFVLQWVGMDNALCFTDEFPTLLFYALSNR